MQSTTVPATPSNVETLPPRHAAIAIAAPSTLAVLRACSGLGQEAVAEKLREVLQRQISFAQALDRRASGVQVSALRVAGDIIRQELESSGEFTAETVLKTTEMVSDVFPELLATPSLLSNGLSSDPQVKAHLFSAGLRLTQLINRLPMDNEPEQAVEFMLSALLSFSEQMVSDESDADAKRAVLCAVMPSVAEMICDTWVDVANAALNPGQDYLQVKDIESQLKTTFLDTLTAFPMGHEGNEIAVIRVLATYIYDLGAMMAREYESTVGAGNTESIRCALVRRMLLPLVRVGWKRVANEMAESVLATKREDTADWLLQHAMEPADLQLVYSEVKRLAASRFRPTQTTKVDLHEVEAVVQDRFATLWGAVKAVETLLGGDCA